MCLYTCMHIDIQYMGMGVQGEELPLIHKVLKQELPKVKDIKATLGTSLVVQWYKESALQCRGLGFNPWSGN